MNKITVLRKVYNEFVKLKNKHSNNEELDQSIKDLEQEIYKSDESLNVQMEFNKTEIDRLSGL